MSIEEYDSDEELELEEENTLEEGNEEDNEDLAAGGFDSDDEEYGKKVRKRIGKEVSKRKVIESERDVYRKEAEETKKQLAELRSKQFEDDKKRLSEEIESDKKLASTALEEGETDKYLDYQEKMTDKKVQLSRNEQEQEFRKEAAPKQQHDNNLSGSANDWMEENSDWIKKDPAKFKRAQRLSNMLEKEGYSVEEGDLYEELDKRLNQAQKPAPVETGNIPNGKPAERSKKDRLTREDKKLMAQYELNPDNAEHRKAWLEGRV